MQKLRPDQVAELVVACQDGDTTYLLARRYRAKRGTVSRDLEETGSGSPWWSHASTRAG